MDGVVNKVLERFDCVFRNIFDVAAASVAEDAAGPARSVGAAGKAEIIISSNIGEDCCCREESDDVAGFGGGCKPRDDLLKERVRQH